MNGYELNRRFDHHVPDEGKIAAHAEARAAAKAFAFILTNLPEGREKALAFTSLEECLFWANAAIAREGN